MKKITTLTLVTILWSVCAAQDNSNTTDKKNFLYLNPLPFIDNTFQLNYERHLSNKVGLLFSGGYTFLDCYDDGKRGGNGEIQLRIYLTDTQNKARRLFYLCPYTRFQYIESTLGIYMWDNDKQEYYYVDLPDVYVSSYAGGLLFGFKWIYRTHLTIDINIGGGVQYSELDGEKVHPVMDVRAYGYYNGLLPKLGIQFGYNF